MPDAPTTLLAVVATILAGSVICWIGALRQLSRRGQFLPYEPRRCVPWGLVDLLLIIVAKFVVSAGAGLILQHLYGIPLGTPLEDRSLEQTSATFVVSGVAELALLALIILLLVIRAGAKARNLGVQWRRAAFDVKLGLIVFLMLLPPIHFVQWLLTAVVKWEYKHPIVELLDKQPSGKFFVIAGFVAVVVAPLAEEFFFRVILQGWLENIGNLRHKPEQLLIGTPSGAPQSQPIPEEVVEQRGDEPKAAPPERPVSLSPRLARPTYWPIVISSGLFAAAHAGQGPAPIPLFLLALGLGYLYQRTHRVLPCIVVHFLVNAVGLLTLWAEVKK